MSDSDSASAACMSDFPSVLMRSTRLRTDAHSADCKKEIRVEHSSSLPGLQNVRGVAHGPRNWGIRLCAAGRTRWLFWAYTLPLAGCGGAQSTLEPAGRDAQRIADLFW